MTNADARALLEYIPVPKKKRGSKLNEWDMAFLSNIKSLVMAGKDLTDKQGNKLCELYRRSQGGA